MRHPSTGEAVTERGSALPECIGADRRAHGGTRRSWWDMGVTRWDGVQADSEEAIGRRQRVEAVLLLSREPLNSRRLAQYARLADGTEARTLVRQLNRLYDETGRAFRVEEVAGGFQLLTRRQFAPWLRRLEHVPRPGAVVGTGHGDLGRGGVSATGVAGGD